MSDDYYDESDELMWVKGPPGEKPTIIRQVHSESTSGSSRDNSGSSACSRKHLLSIENGKVYRTSNSDESLNILEKLEKASSGDSPVIVVNMSEQTHPTYVDKDRIRKWKELHSPRFVKKHQNNVNINNNNTDTSKSSETRKSPTRHASLPIRPISNSSPTIERCASAESASLNRLKGKVRDEGYTSLTEDCKDSDTESIRSKTLPSSWRPLYLDNTHEKNLNKYAQRMTINHDTGVNYVPCDVDSSSKHELSKCNKQSPRNCRNLRDNIETAIEICTCFVCVRSAIYHAEDEDDTDSLVDHPCSCNAPGGKCCARWAVISLLVCFLPLLLCYPPLKCCLSIHDARMAKKERKKEKKKLLKKNVK